LTNYGRLFAAHERGDPVRIRLRDGRSCCGRIDGLLVELMQGALVGRVDLELSPLEVQRVDFGSILAVAPTEFPVPVLSPTLSLRN
jgi:hypothetical protein